MKLPVAKLLGRQYAGPGMTIATASIDETTYALKRRYVMAFR
jgi:hypothetical protein